ncbi:MAG: hypothetical protein GY928_18470 [Colwellia sp.]|nr:hypothetical protein [Colwellia sp.]
MTSKSRSSATWDSWDFVCERHTRFKLSRFDSVTSVIEPHVFCNQCHKELGKVNIGHKYAICVDCHYAFLCWGCMKNKQKLTVRMRGSHKKKNKKRPKLSDEHLPDLWLFFNYNNVIMC